MYRSRTTQVPGYRINQMLQATRLLSILLTAQLAVSSLTLSVSAAETPTDPSLKEMPLDKLIAKANLGNTDAQNELGDRYYEGRTVEENDAEALKWYKKAADLEDGDAMNSRPEPGTFTLSINPMS